MEEMLNTLQKLTETFGPSGAENGIAALIEALARPYADEIRRDALGNLLVHKKGSGKRILFAAHMDSVGVMVTGYTDEGNLRFSQVGGLVPADLLRQQVIFENGTRGVILVSEDKEEKSFKLEDLCIDIGVSKEEEAKKQIPLGSCAAYVPTFYRQNGKIFANYLDNRCGCLLLLEVLKRAKTENDLWLAFTVQEEVGTRGIAPAAYGVDPDIGIAVDVTCTDDLPGSTHTATAKLGGGAAVKVMDGSVLCSPELLKRLEELGKGGNIPTQRDIMIYGGTDAGKLLTTRGGVVTGGITIPCRYTHAPIECIDEKDLIAAIDLAVAAAESDMEELC